MPFGWYSGPVGDVVAAPEETVLRIGFMQRVDSLNPFIGLTDASYVLYGLVYSYLHGIDEDLGTSGDLATEWRIVPDQLPYGSVWEYNLTSYANWTDGVQLTADDVVFTVNLNCQNYDMMWAYQPYAYFMQFAEKIDNDTVWIHYYDRSTGSPIPAAYAGTLSIPIMPKHMLETMPPAEIGFSWNGIFPGEDPPLVGSGPFMATANIYNEYLMGGQITLVRNPNTHWGPEHDKWVNYDKIVMYFYDDATAMRLALEMNMIDVAKFPPWEYLGIVSDVQAGILQDVRTFDGPSPNGYWEEILTCLNNAGPNPSRLDTTIRKAMAMATNKTYIVDNFYMGLAQEGSTLLSPATDWHFEPTVDELMKFNYSAANAMLESSGYRDTDSDGIRECTATSWAVVQGLVAEGTPLSYEMLVRREHPEERDIAMYLDDAWRNVGIDITYIIVDESILATIVYSYTYDLAIWYWSYDVDPNYMLFSQSTKAWNGWSDNKYANASYEYDYNMSVMELDQAARKVYVDSCQRTHYLDIGYIILAYVDQTYAWRTDTFVGWGDWARNPGRSIDAYWGGNELYFDLIPLAGNAPPADLMIDPSQEPAYVDVPTYFSVSAMDLDGDPLSIYIEFGDGSADSSTTPGGSSDPQAEVFTHAYASTGSFTVTLWADDGNGTPLHNASESIVLEVVEPPRSVNYRWYDMFNVPFGEWWYTRWDVYHSEKPITDTFPYIFIYYNSPPGNNIFYSNMRLNITGRDMPQLNMTSRPEFLPFLGTERGGNATIDWYMQYLTTEEIHRYPGSTAAWEDGWAICQNGTTMMDRQAAMAVLGVTSAGFDDFANWWAANEASVENGYSAWLLDEGNDRLDIYNMYEYSLTLLNFDLEAARIGDQVVLSYDVVSWGMEAMMTRWFRDAFIPTEWYFEDLDLHAAIGPSRADVEVDTAVAYSMFASETILDPAGAGYGMPCWAWEGMLGDYVESTIAHPDSDFDPYVDKEYLKRSPGNLWYGYYMPYDYTPGAFNLSEGETLTFEWPVGVPVQFKEQVRDPGTGDPVPGEVNNLTRAITCNYSEPMGSDNPELSPGSFHIDQSSGILSFVGPIDFWTWSRDQAEHQFLADEWDRVGLMPYGMPFLEFGMATGTPPVADFTVYPSEGNISTTFLFDANSSSDIEDPLGSLQVRWDWNGDGSYDTGWSTEKIATHQFSAPGVYDVHLAVLDTDDNVDDANRTVLVVNTAPTASFTVDPVSGGNMTVFEVNASTSHDLEDAPDDLQVRWDWDDDGSWDTSWSYVKNISHTYERAMVYTVALAVMDTMGLIGTATEDVDVIDVHAPVTTASLAGTMGGGGWYTSDATVTLTATDDDNAIMCTWYRLDGGAWTLYSVPFAVSSDGDHLLEFNSTDAVGNVETVKSANVKVDSAAPVTSVELAGTAGADDWFVSAVTVSLSVASEHSGVASSYYSLDSGPMLAYSAPIVVLGAGDHVISYRSVDVAGNSETAKVAYFRVDTEAPETTVTILGTLESVGWYSTPVTVTLSAEDGTSGVAATSYQFGSAGWLPYEAPISISTSGVAQLSVRSEDNAGNVEEDEVMVFMIDLAAPSLSASPPSEQDGGGVFVSWVAVDPQSGIDHIETSLDNGAFVNRQNSSSVTLTGLEEGSHTLVIRAMDRVGNEAQVTVTFEIEGEPGSVLVYVLPAVAVAVIIALLAYLLLWRKRRERAT